MTKVPKVMSAYFVARVDKAGIRWLGEQLKKDNVLINVSEFLQLIEITVFLMEHVSCRPDGMVEYWSIGMLV